MKATQPHTTPHPSVVYDVIISGAGPVGLFLAGELALAQCTVLVLEKAAQPHAALKQLPFGIRGLSAPTIESFYRRGLLPELTVHQRVKNPHANAVQGPRRQVGHFAGIPIHEGDVDSSQWQYRLPGSPAASLISEMEELETVLGRRAAALGVEIRRGFAVTGFQQTGEGVTVQSGGQFFRAQWLVGCDGSRSAVRKTGGFEFAGTEPEFTGYSVRADIIDPEKLRPGRVFTATGMYQQSQPGYLAIQDFDGGAFHGAEAPVTREHVQQVLRRISETDVTIGTLHFATTWTDRARQATAYRNGRVLLAGDAAHIHAPLGGQGLNLGLGDAMNLGWKLAATIRGNAPEGLLDSYYTERHPIGAQVLDWSRAQAAVMGPAPHARALNAILRDLVNTRDGATYFAGRVWGVNTRYELGGHALAGHSVPDFELENGSSIGFAPDSGAPVPGPENGPTAGFAGHQYTRIGAFMHNGAGILLDFNGRASLKALAAAYGHQIKYVTGKAKEQLGLSAVLIRPDGIVAWASEGEPDEASLRQAAARWFSPMA